MTTEAMLGLGILCAIIAALIGWFGGSVRALRWREQRYGLDQYEGMEPKPREYHRAMDRFLRWQPVLALGIVAFGLPAIVLLTLAWPPFPWVAVAAALAYAAWAFREGTSRRRQASGH